MGNIIIPQDMSNLNNERNQLRKRQDEAQGKATALINLSGQLPRTRGPVSSMSPMTVEKTPPAEVAAVLPVLQQQLSQVQNIEKSIQDNRNQIQRIQQDARNLKIMLSVVAILIVLILFFVVLHAVHVF